MRNLMNKSLYSYYCRIIGLCLIMANSVNAQSIIEDSKGTSALSINPGFKATDKAEAEDKPVVYDIPFNLGLITFKTTEKKVDLNYYSFFVPNKKKGLHQSYFGVTGSGAIKNSVVNLFSTNNLATEAQVTLKSGVRLWKSQVNWQQLIDKRYKKDTTGKGVKYPKDVIQDILDNHVKPASDLWLVVNSKFSGSKFKLFNPDLPFDKQIEETNFTGFEINAGLNYWNARVLDQTLLLGATIGIKQTNNFDDLVESTREDTRSVSDLGSGTVRKVTVKETVYSGAYKENKVYPLNFDLYLVPQHAVNVGFLGYSRTDIANGILPKTKLGLGVYFLKNQNAFNPIAGLNFEFADAFNVDTSDDDKRAINKLKISISTRIVIVNNHKRSN